MFLPRPPTFNIHCNKVQLAIFHWLALYIEQLTAQWCSTTLNSYTSIIAFQDTEYAYTFMNVKSESRREGGGEGEGGGGRGRASCHFHVKTNSLPSSALFNLPSLCSSITDSSKLVNWWRLTLPSTSMSRSCKKEFHVRILDTVKVHVKWNLNFLNLPITWTKSFFPSESNTVIYAAVSWTLNLEVQNIRIVLYTVYFEAGGRFRLRLKHSLNWHKLPLEAELLHSNPGPARSL